MSTLKYANKELKGMMKTVKIQEIDNMRDEMMDLMEVSCEIHESLGRSYNVPDDIDEKELMGELDALEDDMGTEIESDGVPPIFNLTRILIWTQNSICLWHRLGREVQHLVDTIPKLKLNWAYLLSLMPLFAVRFMVDFIILLVMSTCLSKEIIIEE